MPGELVPPVSVIVVTFNSESTLVNCLSSIPSSCEIVLVDQCSTDGSVALARRIRPDVKLINAGKNRGFGAGCNLGAANASGDVLIFFNPDAAFLTPDSAGILATTAVRDNVLSGPRILGGDGDDETRARYWTSVPAELGEIFLPARLMVGPFRRDIPEGDEVYRRGGGVAHLQSPFMAVTAENFWRVDGFDEQYFLYREEEILALKLRDIGVRMAVEPRALISHLGGQSTGQVHEFSTTQYYRSEALFYRFRYPKPVALLATCASGLVLLSMAALTPLRRLIGLRRERGHRWYLAAARGSISGWQRRIVVPPTAPANGDRQRPS